MFFLSSFSDSNSENYEFAFFAIIGALALLGIFSVFNDLFAKKKKRLPKKFF